MVENILVLYDVKYSLEDVISRTEDNKYKKNKVLYVNKDYFLEFLKQNPELDNIIIDYINENYSKINDESLRVKDGQVTINIKKILENKLTMGNDVMVFNHTNEKSLPFEEYKKRNDNIEDENIQKLIVFEILEVFMKELKEQKIKKEENKSISSKCDFKYLAGFVSGLGLVCASLVIVSLFL